MLQAWATAGSDAKMLRQVNDELIFETDESKEHEAMPVIVRTMEKASEPAVMLTVPIKVDPAAARIGTDGVH